MEILALLVWLWILYLGYKCIVYILKLLVVKTTNKPNIIDIVEEIKEDTSFLLNKGDELEKNIFSELEKLSGHKKILKNLYIPRGKNGSTEIDILLIHQSGIYVIESKDYSGWIYGNERNFKWTQTFHSNSKNQFYNPIMQNENHLKALKWVLSNFHNINYYSIVIFGERATLKKITYNSSHVLVTKYDRGLPSFLSSANNLNENQIQQIYNTLLNYTNVSEETKANHIEYVKSKIR